MLLGLKVPLNALPLHDTQVTRNMCIVHIEITVGLQQTSYSVLETGGPFSVCAQMFVGDHERIYH